MTHAKDWARLAHLSELLAVAEELSRTFYPEDTPETVGEQWTSSAEMVERLAPIVTRARLALESIRSELRQIDVAERLLKESAGL